VSAPLVLASASLSRAHMLREAGVDLDIIPANIDEDAIKKTMGAQGHNTEDIAMALAQEKAHTISQQHPDALVIGADQILVCDGDLFDKPATLLDAANHLHTLSGREHHLVTAACVLLNGETLWQHMSLPRLTMRALDKGYIADYLAHIGDKALTSVGAYQLEGRGAQLFESVEGDFFAILGLPLLPLLAFLRDRGLM
jgi:septum formation protein